MFCAKWFKAHVTGVDVDKDVFPFLNVLSALNDVTVKPLNKKFQEITPKRLGEHDVVIGSDICFWQNMVKPVQQLVGRALAAGVKRVIITDPGRPTFYDLADRCAKKWTVELNEWYALEPTRSTGEVLEVHA